MFIQKSKTQESANPLDEWLPSDTSTMALWERTLDVIAEPALFFKADGTVFWANPASLSFFGVDANDLLGQHCYEMVRRFGLNYSDCPFERILKSRSPESGMMEFANKWHINRVDPVMGGGGELQGAISRIYDADVSIHLQAATEQLNHLMAATDTAVFMTGTDLRILNWNNGAEEIFGYGAEDLQGTRIHDLVPLSFRKRFAAYADHVMNEEVMEQFSMQGITKNDEVIDVSVSLSPLHDPGGEVSGLIASSRNITSEHDVDMRLVQHLTDSAAKVNGPLSHMRTNMEETVAALQDGLLTTEELVMFLTLQMKSIGLIEENLGEINKIAIDGIDGVPVHSRKYLFR